MTCQKKRYFHISLRTNSKLTLTNFILTLSIFWIELGVFPDINREQVILCFTEISLDPLCIAKITKKALLQVYVRIKCNDIICDAK